MSFLPPHRRGHSPTVLGAVATILAAMADETEVLGAQLYADPALVVPREVPPARTRQTESAAAGSAMERVSS